MSRTTPLARIWPLTTLLFVGVAACGVAQARVPGTVVIATPGDPTIPLPYLGGGLTHNADVADQLFLRFAVLAPSARTVGDDALLPMLARSWKRLDSLTMEFEIDPRARWQDGVPVTAHDAVFTWGIANNPITNKDIATVESIANVEEIGPRTVRVRFKRAFPEQLFRFAFDFQPLPSHLLEKIPAESLVRSDFVAHPVGNGPYRWSRRVPGQLVELQADSSFFLGRPGIARVMFRVVPDAMARLNLLLAGELDLMDGVTPVSLPQVTAVRGMRVQRVANNNLVYALFNERSANDTSLPNPILTDIRVREALTLALDRQAMANAVYGSGSVVPDAAQSRLWGWITGTTSHPGADVARARTLLAAAGWRDSDGDGVLDRNGAKLQLSVIYPSSSPPRVALATQAQAMWKAIGVTADLHPYPGSNWQSLHNAGKFDIDMGSVLQDASPSSLTEAWSCASAKRGGPPNVAHWCDASFDQLVATAVKASNPVAAWRSALNRMASQFPAAFLAAPENIVAIHSRFDKPILLPVRELLYLWQWRIRPGAAIARDR